MVLYKAFLNLFIYFIIFIILVVILTSTLRVLKEYERGVIFRLGRYVATKGPGLIILLPVIDRMVKVSLRTVVMDVAPQDVITKDNVSIKVNAVVYFRVVSAEKAVIEVQDFMAATSQLAQTTLRSVLGYHELDELLAERERINAELQKILDEHTEPWGIKVTTVELKQIELPQEMQRAIARQAEAERERRAKIISAEGEYQAAQTLASAAEIIGKQPAALQLRFLQTLIEVASENTSTLVLPLPIDLIKPFLTGMEALSDRIQQETEKEG